MVERGRLVRVWAKPSTAELHIQVDGSITTQAGGPVSGGFMVGKWARVAGPAVLPPGGSVSMARDIWVEGVHWSNERYSIY
jgi:hypothetical protein